MTHRTTISRRARLAGAAVFCAALPVFAGLAPATAAPTGTEPSTGSVSNAPTGPMAKEMAEQLTRVAGGVQLNDNTLYYPADGATVVWPSPGQTTAPVLTSSSIWPDAARRAGITSFQSQFGTSTVNGCPSGITAKDYY